MKKKIALITGASGYLGKQLTKELHNAGWMTIGLDRRNILSERELTIEKIHRERNNYLDFVFYGDIRNPGIYNQIFDKFKVDVVFHLASRIEAGISFKEPTEFYSTNTGGTTLLLNAMNKAGVNNIIFSSSAAVYMAKDTPISEDDPKVNNSPYGFSKLCAEEAIKDSQLNYAIFRYFNLAGADEDMGENHNPETHVIPLILTSDNFTVYGRDFNTPDGTCIRDYVHVIDVARAHISAAEKLLEGKPNMILNLGSGEGHSILDLISVVQAHVKEIRFKNGDRREGDASSLVADITKAKEVLNYKPLYNIVDIIKSAYRWHFPDDR